MDGGDDDYSDYSALYLGWMCNEEGTGIQLAAYRDEDCTLYYPRVSAANLTDMDYEMFEKVQEVLPRALSTSQSCGTPPDYILPDGKVVTADWDGDGNSYYNTEEPQESAFCMALYGQTENGYYEDQDQDYVSIRMSTCGVYTAYAGDEDVQEAEADGYEGYEDQVEAGVFSSFNMATSFEEMMAAYNATYDGQQNDNENDGQQNDDAEYQGPEQYEACQFLNTQDIASTIAYNPYLSNSDNPDAQNPYEIDYSDPAYISNYTWGEDSNFDHSLYPFENGDDYESPTATATGSVLASSLETGGKIALIVIAVAASIIACTLILGIGKKSNSEDKKSPLLGETAVPKAPSGPIQEVVRSVSTISKATVQSIRNFAEAEKEEEEPVPDSVSAPVPELESAPVSAFEAVPAVTSVQSAATAPSLVVTVPVPAVPVPDPEAASVPVPVSAPVPEPEPAVEKKKPYKRPFLAKVSKSLFGKRKNTTK